MNRIAALLIAASFACAPPSQARDARTSYNAGLGLASSGNFADGIDLLAKARANSAGDPEVRYRAAFALGDSYARWAESAGEGEEQLAVDRLTRAEAWFRDAIRQREGDENARHNLALAISRRRELVDRLTAGGRTLEARLDLVLADQRVIRDELRAAEASLEAGAVTASVLAPTLESLATRERSLAADVGVISDLAADERSEIEAVAEADRSPEQGGRLAQLGALVHYLDRARTSIGDARLAARREGVERASRRSETAVGELVRAREQLLNPALVIQGLAAEESQLFQQTSMLAALEKGEIAITGGGGEEKPEPPPHLAAPRLADRQLHLHERASELDSRLTAFVAHQAAEAPSDEHAQGQAEAKKVLAKAAPFISAAVASMKAAADGLGADDVSGAAPPMAEALTNLARALEYFAGLRQLIELTYADQNRATALLDPSSAGEASLSTEERSRQLVEIATLGRERLERMVTLLEREKQSNLGQLQQAQQQGGEGGEEEKAAIEAKFAKAESHRAVALAAIISMSESLAGRTGDPLASANVAKAELEELRRLFFSLIEHLKDLHRRQGTTRDGTSAASAANDEERPALLGPLASAQIEHAGLGSQIGEALAAQADSASPATQQQGGPDPEKLAAAADEVRQATSLMEAASLKLGKATEEARTMSVDLEPPLEDQKSAIEHLATAIELLTPPKEQENQEQDQKQDNPNNEENQDQQQEQQGQGEGQGDLSQSELERRLRALRENEANRRREREKRKRGTGVEKDW